MTLTLNILICLMAANLLVYANSQQNWNLFQICTALAWFLTGAALFQVFLQVAVNNG